MKIVTLLGTLLTAAVAGLGVLPTAASECELVPLHKVLSSPGGVGILRDGREIKVETHSVGGCKTIHYDPTGARNMYEWTLMSQTSRRCVTGTGDDGQLPTYVGFQAITVTANGFRFATRFSMEDIDATRGFRKTMTSLGVAGGRIVRPQLTLAPGALVGIRDFVMPRASLAAIGFPADKELLIDGVAFNASEPKSTPSDCGGGGAVALRRSRCLSACRSFETALFSDECIARMSGLGCIGWGKGLVSFVILPSRPYFRSESLTPCASPPFTCVAILIW